MAPRPGCASSSVSTMGQLDLYYTILSQPSRTVVMLLEMHNIAFNKKKLDLFAGETRTPEFLAINPLHTVPTAVDDEFAICASSAIVNYICGKFKFADHWYPSDLKMRAKVDMLLDWYPSTIRKCGTAVFLPLAMGPHIGNPTLTAEDIDKLYTDLDESLTALEDLFLKDQTFLCGNEITIADLFCANEIFQPTCCERDIFKTHPKTKEWMERVRQRMNPVWDNAIEEFRELLKGYQTKE